LDAQRFVDDGKGTRHRLKIENERKKSSIHLLLIDFVQRHADIQ
jgi:hypothetical protein